MPIWNDLLVPIITIDPLDDEHPPLETLFLHRGVRTHSTRWNLVFGGTFIVSVPILLVFLFLQRYFVRGVVAGAIKG